MIFALGARAAASGYGLVVFDQAGSTNIEAMAAARQGAKASWFVTTEQTAGRGRRQRPWIAPRGNLASSVLEVLNVAPAVAATLGFAACLAISSALRQVSREAVLRSGGSSNLDFSVKWPNDVLAGGRKIVGMLLEAEQVAGGLAVVAGIGTNVVAAPTDTPTPAVSLRDLGVEVSAEDLFTALSDCWVEYFGIWNAGRGFGEIRKLWLERAAGLGQPVAIRSGHAIIEGIFDTIDEQGCMLVRTAEGRLEPITAGDVHFGSVASKGAV